MYRVKKADGWNRYKVQRKWFWLFWVGIDNAIYCGEGLATFVCLQLSGEI